MAEVKLTAFQQEQMKAIEKIMNYKLICEANIVASLYKEPDSIFNYDLKLSDFHNNAWRIFFVILEDLIVKEKKVPDDITIGFYLEKHDKLRKEFDKFGGMRVLVEASENVKVENLDGYIQDLYKYKAILGLIKYGFPVGDKVSEFVDMSAEDVFCEYEALLMHTFAGVEGNINTYNGADGIHKLIDEFNEGKMVGLPLNDAPILSNEIGGLNRGHIYGLGAGTGQGKTTTALHWLLPSVIHNDEKILLLINEEDHVKVRVEILIYVINNVFKTEFKKQKLRNGKFSEQDLIVLRKAADWIEAKKESNHITIIPLERYTTKIAIKLMKKYINLGIHIILLDTLKASADVKGDSVWLAMQQDMVELYNVIKPSNKNAILWVNYQLGKSAVKKRYLTSDEVSMSKSILDVMSVNIMMRDVLDSEFEGGKHEILCYKIVGKSRIQFKLNDKTKKFVVIFLTKSRFGESDIQIVAERNLSTNKYIEIGYAKVIQDY